jgi:hypothetical protein
VKSQSDGLWCDPFISRNCIYFFDQFEPKLLCVSLSPEQKGADKLLKTYPDPRQGYPNHKYLNRAVQSFDDSVLVSDEFCLLLESYDSIVTDELISFRKLL